MTGWPAPNSAPATRPDTFQPREEMTMRVTHPINLVGGDVASPGASSRYRVYWTRLPDNNLKSFGVVDTAVDMGLLGNAVLLDAQESDGRAHCIRVAASANALDVTATALGLRVETLVLA